MRSYFIRGTPLLVAEQGFVGDRSEWTSLGWNGVNGRADFRNDGSPPDRWDRYHRDALRPWRGWRYRLRHDSRPVVLIVGQVDGDATIDAGIVLPAWYNYCANSIRRVGWEPAFRPHPLNRLQVAPEDARLMDGPLSEVLDEVSGVATYSSNIGVDATLAGLPCFVDGRSSMILRLAAKSISGLSYLYDEPEGRRQWANDIAYAQWTLDELADGTAWDHLKWQ